MAKSKIRRVALVTGTGRNIGRAIALQLARDGHQVACFDREVDALQETVRMITKAKGRASLHIGDAATHEAIESFARDAIAEHGGADVVINNAGEVHEVRVEDMAPSEFKDSFNVNLFAGYTLARAAYPSMRERGGGVVINIGSIFGSMGVASAVAYCTAKAALEGMTRALAAEWARDQIRVLCVAPGYVETSLNKEVLDDLEMRNHILSRIPLRRVAQSEEIASLVGYLVSDKASFMTGETHAIDGGQRMVV